MARSSPGGATGSGPAARRGPGPSHPREERAGPSSPLEPPKRPPERPIGSLEIELERARQVGLPASAPRPTGAPEPRPSRPRRLVLRADGAARGNPGPAALGVVLVDGSRPDALDPAAEPIASISAYLGRTTNNVAEWTAVVRGLELARELGAEIVDLFLDSELIVEQLHGRYRVRDPKLQPLWSAARTLLGGLRRWSVSHVPRAQNHQADRLANEALDRVAAGGPAVVVRRPRGEDAPVSNG
ncbi:MAG TPA: ribonuclease HI family protein [Candidatus Limnocylindrales bacterium]|nr:ribonuclease HI family protein [Candidatus Limnocylindrales bacterium]